MMQLRSGMNSRASTGLLTNASALLEGKQTLNSLSVFPGQKSRCTMWQMSRLPHWCPSAWHRGCQCRGCAVARKSPHTRWGEIEGVLVLVRCRGLSQSNVWSEGNSDSDSLPSRVLGTKEGDVKEAATVEDPSFGERVRVSRGRSDQSTNQRSTSLSLEPVCTRFCPVEYGYGPYSGSVVSFFRKVKYLKSLSASRRRSSTVL
jgi:hypothetical protein